MELDFSLILAANQTASRQREPGRPLWTPYRIQSGYAFTIHAVCNNPTADDSHVHTDTRAFNVYIECWGRVARRGEDEGSPASIEFPSWMFKTTYVTNKGSLSRHITCRLRLRRFPEDRNGRQRGVNVACDVCQPLETPRFITRDLSGLESSSETTKRRRGCYLKGWSIDETGGTMKRYPNVSFVTFRLRIIVRNFFLSRKYHLNSKLCLSFQQSRGNKKKMSNIIRITEERWARFALSTAFEETEVVEASSKLMNKCTPPTTLLLEVRQRESEKWGDIHHICQRFQRSTNIPSTMLLYPSLTTRIRCVSKAVSPSKHRRLTFIRYLLLNSTLSFQCLHWIQLNLALD